MIYGKSRAMIHDLKVNTEATQNYSETELESSLENWLIGVLGDKAQR